MCLGFVGLKADNYIINAFRSLIKQQPVNVSLVPEPPLPGDANNVVDVHVLSRFLKKVATGPCLLITETIPDQNILEKLLPKAQVSLISAESHIESVINQIQNFADTHGGYATILTNLPSQAHDTQVIRRQIPQLCYVDVEGLLNQDKANIQVDMPKLLKLMKRNIHVVCTAALIPRRYEQRKNQYIRALRRIVEFGYHPYIVESCVQGPTFLDDWSKDTLYSQTNDVSLKNKGVNEFKSLLYAFNDWNFDDDDIIVKLTGRYFFQADAFIRSLENMDNIDCAAKFVTVPVTGVDAVLTGCFAMRFGLFKEMLEFFDYDELERAMICVEHVVGPYLNNLSKKGYNVIRRKKLDIEANMFYTHGSNEISYW
jgi:hypothetical protein